MQLIKRNNRWIALTAAIIMVICLVMAAIPTGIAKADSFPTIPNQFYGTVKNNGSLVSTGYTVIAKVNGTQMASIATNSGGQYGYDSAFYVATDDGNTIEFFVNGVQAAETFTASAGSAIQVNLTVSGAAATTTATTTNPTTTTPATTTTTTTTATTATGSTTTTTSGSGDTNSNTVVSQPSQPAVVAQAPASQPVQSGNAQSPVNQQPAQQQQAPAKSSDSSLSMALIVVVGIAVTMFIIVIVLLVKRRQQY